MKLFPQPNKTFITVQRKVIIDLGFFILEIGLHFPIATPVKKHYGVLYFENLL